MESICSFSQSRALQELTLPMLPYIFMWLWYSRLLTRSCGDHFFSKKIVNGEVF